jgi:hypothetical protein
MTPASADEDRGPEGYTPEECQNPDVRVRMAHLDDSERLQSEDEQPNEPDESS